MKKIRDSDLFINARISKDNSLIYSKTTFFVVPKYLNPFPKFEYEVQASDEKVYIQIKAISFIYQLYIVCNNSEGVFSDNYFDLIPQEVITIYFILKEKYGY